LEDTPDTGDDEVRVRRTVRSSPDREIVEIDFMAPAERV
jgi:hypothetical protein